MFGADRVLENPMAAYDAILIVSFGGPEGPDDVMPFLENVLKGRNVPKERMMEVAKHYDQFGGVSPINEHNRKLIAALEEVLKEEGPDLPVYWGNRNWKPFLSDAIGEMAKDGVKRAVAFVTSAYGSYSGCRQYLENIEAARQEVGEDAPVIDKLRLFFNHPGFIHANVEHLKEAMSSLDTRARENAKIVFTAHSIPDSMAQNCEYADQLTDASMLVADLVHHSDWALAYQSRSGPANQPWLGPDICDYLKELQQQEYKDVIVLPIGFICDHLEVIYDLDTEAKKVAGELGINMIRVPTAGTHPKFINMIRELIAERVEDYEPRALGEYGLVPTQCSTNCCKPALRPVNT